jgi:hypothetical protein
LCEEWHWPSAPPLSKFVMVFLPISPFWVCSSLPEFVTPWFRIRSTVWQHHRCGGGCRFTLATLLLRRSKPHTLWLRNREFWFSYSVFTIVALASSSAVIIVSVGFSSQIRPQLGLSFQSQPRFDLPSSFFF